MRAAADGAIPKPIVVVSKCLGFDACRYNGEKIPDRFLDKLEPYCDFRLVCPEVEIGLGVPRDPVRLVKQGESVRLLQPASGRDLTTAMERFSRSYLTAIDEVDGFVLKGRSPSCGVNDARLYPDRERAPSLGRRPGLFAAAVLERYPLAAVEDEGRLLNFRIREHFLTRLFLRARFRELKAQPTAGGLVRFQARNKMLLMAYNQTRMRRLGRIVADCRESGLEAAVGQYERELAAATAKLPRYTSQINVLMHTLGFFSKQLQADEKRHFLGLLERFRAGRVPASAPLSVARSWVLRFDHEYLREQTFFEPYPEPLVEITDSGKGRSGR